MQIYNDLASVIALAEFAHRNQVDKAGLPYFSHPERVMKAVQAQGALPYVQMGAILHDVVEDTAFTADMLLELGVPSSAVNIVTLLTKAPGVSNIDYYLKIRENEDARRVKLADIHDNTQAWRMAYLDKESQERLKKKYNIANHYLQFCEHLLKD
jgi:(p)ppGpp synthase/HD superfamily hydrolase